MPTAHGKVTVSALAKAPASQRVILAQDTQGRLYPTPLKTGVSAIVTGATPDTSQRIIRWVLHTDMGDTVSMAPSQTLWLARPVPTTEGTPS